MLESILIKKKILEKREEEFKLAAYKK